MAEKVRLLQKEKDINVQETIAHAINAVAKEHQIDPVLSIKKEKILNRVKSLAKPVTTLADNHIRTGKVRLAGWFSKEEVENVKSMKSVTKMSVDSMIKHGISILINENDTA